MLYPFNKKILHAFYYKCWNNELLQRCFISVKRLFYSGSGVTTDRIYSFIITNLTRNKAQKYFIVKKI